MSGARGIGGGMESRTVEDVAEEEHVGQMHRWLGEYGREGGRFDEAGAVRRLGS